MRTRARYRTSIGYSLQRFSLRLLLVYFTIHLPLQKRSADGPPLNPYTECKYPGECASAFWEKALLVKNDFCIPLAFIFELARNLPSALPRACANYDSRGSLTNEEYACKFLIPANLDPVTHGQHVRQENPALKKHLLNPPPEAKNIWDLIITPSYVSKVS